MRRAVSLPGLLALTLFTAAAAPGAGKGAFKVGPKEKCPVCGMFVAKYPSFAARIDYRDGSNAVFDGPKDMFAYYLNPKKYSPGKPVAQIASITVTDYYSMKPVDGSAASYVLGSDVLGPMGKELVP